jgi:hypothetical protein
MIDILYDLYVSSSVFVGDSRRYGGGGLFVAVLFGSAVDAGELVLALTLWCTHQPFMSGGGVSSEARPQLGVGPFFSSAEQKTVIVASSFFSRTRLH